MTVVLIKDDHVETDAHGKYNMITKAEMEVTQL